MSLSLECLLDGSGDTSMRTNMMKFLRNATLLCLSAFPKNHLLQEAVLVADELSNTRMGTLSSSVTPCRALAKTLLKKNRQVNAYITFRNPVFYFTAYLILGFHLYFFWMYTINLRSSGLQLLFVGSQGEMIIKGNFYFDSK